MPFEVLRIRLAKDFKMPPSHVGKLFSQQDVLSILAFEQMQNEEEAEQSRMGELKNKATQERNKSGS